MMDFLDPDLIMDLPTNVHSIDVYLVGPGDRTPFSSAFKAADAGDIYSAYKPFKQEWKDLWFAKASSELISFLNTEGRSTLFQKPASDLNFRGGVDVVHLHGATNAMVAFYLRQYEQNNRAGPRFPAIVYTLHDSLDEVEYSNLVSHTHHFLDSPPTTSTSLPQTPLYPLEPYIYGSQVFTSALGIDLADMVTFVSRSIAKDIVEGRFKFSLHNLVMPSISIRARTASFIGVTNGLDFTEPSKNPFISPELLRKGLTFPRLVLNFTASEAYESVTTNYPVYSEVRIPHSATSFSDTKLLAKQHLIQSFPHLFDRSDLSRPFFLFIGRFQYNKGCQFFEPLLAHISSPTSLHHNARLIVLGAPNNYPLSHLRSLQARYPNHMTLIHKSQTQAEIGTRIRMASDIAFMPSFSEAFGLVAAEGLLFGMPVVSTGVGGLREFLHPMSSRSKAGNSYLFGLKGTGIGEDGEAGDLGVAAEYSRPEMEALRPAIEACLRSVDQAILDWKMRMEGEWLIREKFTRLLVEAALELKWSRDQGPVEEVS